MFLGDHGELCSCPRFSSETKNQIAAPVRAAAHGAASRQVIVSCLRRCGEDIMRNSFAIAAALLLPIIAAAHAGDKVEVTGAQFGIFCQSETGAVSFVPGTTVPLVTGQAYGWVIKLKTDKPTVHWREEFTLPTAPISWGNPSEDFQPSISPDKKVSVLERDAPLDTAGIIFNSWSVVEGDPEGKYKIRVIVDKTIEQIFEFDVVKPGSAQTPVVQCSTKSVRNAMPGAQVAWRAR